MDRNPRQVLEFIKILWIFYYLFDILHQGLGL